jgi:hypothetical protein
LSSDGSSLPIVATFDFFDINSGKVLSGFNGRYHSESSHDIPKGVLVNLSSPSNLSGYEVATSSCGLATNLELRITRKNPVKITNMSRFGNDDNRSVVNVASDKFYQQTKMKKLAETYDSER